MNSNEQDIDQFDAYLKSQMTDQERSAFEKRLLEEKAFAEAFMVHQTLVEGIKDHGREELKAYLKQHGKIEYWGENFWPKSMTYAAAAVFVLFLGVYFVVKNTIQHEQKDKIAISQTEDIQQEQRHFENAVEEPIKNIEPEETAKTDTKLTEVIPPPVIQEEIQEMDEVNLYAVEANARPVKEDVLMDDAKYKVLSEKKLKDTTVIVPVLYVTLNRKDSKLTLKTQGNRNYTGSTSTVKQLPQNASNQVQSDVLDKTEFKDTVLSSTTKKLETKETNKTLIVEYWSSPVNFKGYRYINNILQLYTVDSKLASLYFYMNKLYLRLNGKVYVLEPCTDACTFRTEPDTDIVNTILIQK